MAIPHLLEVWISPGLCSQLDLSEPQRLPVADWVLSLEVGEHIPRAREGVFLRNVASPAMDGVGNVVLFDSVSKFSSTSLILIEHLPNLFELAASRRIFRILWNYSPNFGKPRMFSSKIEQISPDLQEISDNYRQSVYFAEKFQDSFTYSTRTSANMT